MMDQAEELLFRQCKEFVDEQSEGELDDETIAKNADAMMAFIDRVRPPRAKLNMEATADVVAALDGSARREDKAWKIAQLAATLCGGAHAIGRGIDSVGSVRTAASLLAESRCQAAAATEG